MSLSAIPRWPLGSATRRALAMVAKPEATTGLRALLVGTPARAVGPQVEIRAASNRLRQAPDHHDRGTRCSTSRPTLRAPADRSGDRGTSSRGVRPRRASRVRRHRPASEMGSIHKLCVRLLRNRRAPFHVKRRRWLQGCPRLYPQGAQAFYVVFHVKLACLWITSVDNFGRGAALTYGDVDLRVGSD